MAARALKIGVHLRFDPISLWSLSNEHFDQKYFRQAYYLLFQKIVSTNVFYGENSLIVKWHDIRPHSYKMQFHYMIVWIRCK